MADRDTPRPSSPSAAKRMKSTAQRNTEIELRLRRMLFRRGYRYRLHTRVPGVTRARPDFAFIRERVAVFVDSCFWHGCQIHGSMPKKHRRWWASKLKANMNRDRRHSIELRSAGWRVVRVWEHEHPKRASVRIEEAIRASRLRSLRKRFAQTVLKFRTEPTLRVNLRLAISANTRRHLRHIGVAAPFVILTPFNPAGRQSSRDANRALLGRLREDLAKQRLAWIDADGSSINRKHSERGCAFSASIQEAATAGKAWSQDAVFWFDGRRFWVVPSGSPDKAIALPRKASREPR
jgi:DNA mismatch endonuclease (patch repair protein)